MPWLRMGDDAAMYPKLLDILEYELADDRLINECFGFLVRCSTTSANYITDYIVTYGTAVQIAGPTRVEDVTDALAFAGLLIPLDPEDGRRRWEIFQDPEFIHMRTADELEWEKQRKTDNSNPELTIQVRVRDGDACRYCGSVVNFKARKGKLGGTYDHRVPGQAATVETMVVACGSCNARRRDNPDADRMVPLLPEPSPPYYSKSTVEWINGHQWSREHGIVVKPTGRHQVPVGKVPPGHASHIAQPELYAVSMDDPSSPRAGRSVDRGTPPEAASSPRTDRPADRGTPDHPEHRAEAPATSPSSPRAGRSVDRGTPPEAASSPRTDRPADRGTPDRGRRRPAPVDRGTPPEAASSPRTGEWVGAYDTGLRALDEGKPPPPARTPDLLDPADNLPDPPDSADCQCAGSGKAGSGRVGSVRAGMERSGKRRRRSRTRRGKRR
ncbi:hypothetical protein [Corynebacterium antarcticum]|uniref:hypothetical protein n=1 Tax=Corynebacterium antarcticum TaxID=2800405 RepID=UPI0020061D4C|nr:hypothetical protein [Corynebacterium antarcticum]MCK7661983.1 hypothetical protein [Corynebacterium antarcticum]